MATTGAHWRLLLLLFECPSNFALLLFLLLLLVLYTHNAKRIAKTIMPSALPRPQLIKRAAVATAGSQSFSAVPKGAWVGQFLHLLALAVEVPFGQNTSWSHLVHMPDCLPKRSLVVGLTAARLASASALASELSLFCKRRCCCLCRQCCLFSLKDRL